MNNNTDNFTFTGRVRSIRHAIDGIMELLKSQHNAWIHLVATTGVVFAGLLFHIDAIEWCFLVLTIALVWVCEALNTALEILCDVVSPEIHPLVKKSKDVAAGAVLLSAIGASIIGIIIFLPYVLNSI